MPVWGGGLRDEAAGPVTADTPGGEADVRSCRRPRREDTLPICAKQRKGAGRSLSPRGRYRPPVSRAARNPAEEIGVYVKSLEIPFGLWPTMWGRGFHPKSLARRSQAPRQRSRPV